MSTRIRVTTFLGVLLAVGASAYAVGSLVGPVGMANSGPSTSLPMAGDGSHGGHRPGSG